MQLSSWMIWEMKRYLQLLNQNQKPKRARKKEEMNETLTNENKDEM